MTKQCAMPECINKPKRSRKYCPEHFGGQGNPDKTYNGKKITYTIICKAYECENIAEGNRYYCNEHRAGVGVISKKYKGNFIKSSLVEGKML